MFSLARVHLSLACFFTLLFTCGLAFAQNEEIALKMVKTLRLGENLAPMSFQTSKGTQTYRMIELEVGVQKADEILRAELASSIPKYQDQWNRNLAQIWAARLTREEMESITALQKQSPYVPKFMSLVPQVGEAMKAKSSPILKEATAEALMRAFDRSTQGKK